MAFCPQCKGEMGMTEIKCNKCGYDIPQKYWPSDHEKKWEYSVFSDYALLLGGYFSLVGSLVTCIVSVIIFISGKFMYGLLGLCYAVTLFGVFVALLRVRTIKK